MNVLTEKHAQFIQLKNGLSSTTLEKKGQNSVYLHVWVTVGSIYENKKNSGISHFLEHMIFRGNKKLGKPYQVNLAFEEMGGNINASTSSHHLEVWFNFHKDFFKEGITKFCQFLQYPDFQDIELERSIILEEMKEDYDEEDALVEIESINALNMWKGQALGLPIIGTEESVNSIDVKQLSEWHSKFFHPENIHIGVVGDFSTQEYLDIINEELNFPYISKHHSPIKEPESIFSLDSKDKFFFQDTKDNQFDVCWSFVFKEPSLIDRLYITLLDRYLDDGFCSLLQKSIREEKGLVYDISSNICFYPNLGTLSISATASDNKILSFVKTLSTLLDDLSKNGITQKDLDYFKKRNIFAYEFQEDSPDGRLFLAISPHTHPQNPNKKEFNESVENFNLQEINELIQKLFSKKQTFFSIVGPNSDSISKKIETILKPWF